MNKAIIALALLGLLVLFVVGCKAPVDEQTTPEIGGEVAEEGTLTGDITEIDNLDSEISDEELEDIEASLDEIDW